MFAYIFWGSLLFIAYLYAGYPLCLALLSKMLRQPLQPENAGLPQVTLLIAAYNEEATIAQKLDNCLALDYPTHALQILISVDGSMDQTANIVTQYADRGVILVHSLDRAGKTAALNRAMPLATGTIIVISDANNTYPRETLRTLVTPFADPELGAVAGAKVILKGDSALGNAESRYWRYESFIKSRETEISSCIGATGEILAFRREHFDPFPAHVIHDDLYLALKTLKQGYRVIYLPEARSYERISPDAADEMTRRRRLIVGRLQLMTSELMPWRRPLLVWQIISHKFLRPFVIFAMLAAGISNLLAVFWPSPGGLLQLAAPWNQILLAGQVLFYAAALLGNLWGGHRLLKNLLYVPTFLVNSNLAALLGIGDYVRGRREKTWNTIKRQAWVESDDEQLG